MNTHTEGHHRVHKGLFFRLIALTKRLITAAFALGIAVFLAMIINYGSRQEYAEYQLKNLAVADISARGSIDQNDLATIMGIAHKESRFWNGAVGRNHEAGVMQLSESVARDYGLKVATSARKSSPLQKLLFLPPNDADIARDQRLDERISMRVGIDHFLSLKRRLQARYNFGEEQARDLAILAFHFGEANTWRWIECSPDQTLNSVLNLLADPALPRETWFKRAVAVSFSEHVLRYRAALLKDMPAVIERASPSSSDLLENISATPKEFYTRLFKDMQELDRAMKERDRIPSHQCPGGA